MERNPCFLEQTFVPAEAYIDPKNQEFHSDLSQECKFRGFDMSNWVVRESLIFMQKLIKHLTKKDTATAA